MNLDKVPLSILGYFHDAIDACIEEIADPEVRSKVKLNYTRDRNFWPNAYVFEELDYYIPHSLDKVLTKMELLQEARHKADWERFWFEQKLWASFWMFMLALEGFLLFGLAHII